MNGVRAWLLLAILIALHILSFLDRFIVLLMVDPIRAEFGVSDFQIGMLHGAAFGLFYAVFGIPLGWLADRAQRRLVIFGGVLVWSLATFASGVAVGFNHLFFARLLVGAGEAALVPAAYSMLSDSFPRHRLAFAMSLFAAAVPVGAAAGIAIGGLLVKATAGMHVVLPLFGPVHDWQIPFLLLGVAGLPAALLIFLVPEPVREDRRRLAGPASAQGFFDFARSRLSFFLPLFIAAGFAAMMGNGTFGWMPTYIVRVFRWDAANIGVVMGLTAAIFGVIGSSVSGYVVDRWFAAGRRDAHVRYYAFGLALTGVWTICAFNVPSAWLCFFFFALVQLCAQFYGVAAAAIQLVTPPQFRGRMSAIYIFTYNVMGIGLGPIMVGALTDFVLKDDMKVGMSLTLLAMICAPLAALLFAWAGRAMRRLLAVPAEDAGPLGALRVAAANR